MEITETEIETMCAALAAQAPPPSTSAWAFCCTLRPTHQRGSAGFSAQASTLGLPLGVWPATLLCQLPKRQRVLFRHAYHDANGLAHVYRSVKPQTGMTLIVWQD